MNYKIKNYEDGFIQDQFEIGSQIYDFWEMGGQTRPEELKKIYSSEEFDPETRFYAFEDDEMVGFLTASFSEERDGNQVFYFEFPYVKPEHVPEAEIQLIKHAIEKLKEKGADILLARAGDYWGKSRIYAEKYGFEKTTDIARRAEIDLKQSNLKEFPKLEHIFQFDKDLHFEGIVKLYARKYDMELEQARNRLSRWKNLNIGDTFKNPWDQLITLLGHYVAVVDGSIVGRVDILNFANFGKKTANINQFVIDKKYQNLKGELLRAAIECGRQNDKDILIIHTGLWGAHRDDDYFSEFDLEFSTKLAYYEKKLV